MKLRAYAEKYMLDVFQEIYKVDYVGTDYSVYDSKMMHASCKLIAKICMEYRAKIVTALSLLFQMNYIVKIS